MRCLIVEDDFGSRRLLQAMLREYGASDVVVDGQEAIDAFRLAWEENNPYDLVFLDIMMPNVDGQEALRRIRATESEIGIRDRDRAKVVMTTALGDPENVVQAFYEGGADGYVVKPIKRETLVSELEKLGLKPVSK
jgi:two-component system, chemotaxis family, chemotaxis protein CheY